MSVGPRSDHVDRHVSSLGEAARHLLNSLPGGSEGSNLPCMGLNPFRQQRKTLLDAALVVTFIVITLALVLWGFFG